MKLPSPFARLLFGAARRPPLAVAVGASLVLGAVFYSLAAGRSRDSNDALGLALHVGTDHEIPRWALKIGTSPASVVAALSNMAPGDQETIVVTVTNAGSVPLRYAVTSTTTENTLAAQLSLTIKSGVRTCTDPAFGAGGPVVYGPANLGNTDGTHVIGDTLSGAQAGDRSLAPGAAEVLCFNISLPLTTSNMFQGLTTATTFAFVVEQMTVQESFEATVATHIPVGAADANNQVGVRGWRHLVESRFETQH